MKNKYIDLIDQTSISKQILKEFFLSHVPQKICVKMLKNMFSTFVAFPPSATETKWKLFRVKQGHMNTSKYKLVKNLKHFKIKKKWDTDSETLSIARHFKILYVHF